MAGGRLQASSSREHRPRPSRDSLTALLLACAIPAAWHVVGNSNRLASSAHLTVAQSRSQAIFGRLSKLECPSDAGLKNAARRSPLAQMQGTVTDEVAELTETMEAIRAEVAAGNFDRAAEMPVLNEKLTSLKAEMQGTTAAPADVAEPDPDWAEAAEILEEEMQPEQPAYRRPKLSMFRARKKKKTADPDVMSRLLDNLEGTQASDTWNSFDAQPAVEEEKVEQVEDSAVTAWKSVMGFDDGATWVECPYNPNHKMPSGALEQHMERCPDKPTQVRIPRKLSRSSSSTREFIDPDEWSSRTREDRVAARDRRSKGSGHFEEREKFGPADLLPESPVRLELSDEVTSLLRVAVDASSEIGSGDGEGLDEDFFEDEIGEEEAAVLAQLGDWLKEVRQEATPIPKRAANPEKLRSVRESLPAFEFRSQILQAVQDNQVIIIEGSTGCGKTTQVGNYILEDAAERNVACSITCTQPRRISATTVAARVADERGEQVGEEIGYVIRGERNVGDETKLLFCTTGILLRRLANDPDLDGTTHVLVDEVHERNVESDFLMLALRDLLQRREDLRIILMSATLEQNLFSEYFGGVPSIVIPSRAFPVEEFFLEDALAITGHQVNPAAEWAAGSMKNLEAKNLRQESDAEKREDFLNDFGRYDGYPASVLTSLRTMDQDAVNFELLASLLQGNTLEELAKSRPNGDQRRPPGVLVFLSGLKQIQQAISALLSLPEFFESDIARTWILPLHGSQHSWEQKRVFESAPPGVRKIVLATNVAETSVTIDDIGYVVDTCRMKEMRFNAARRISALEDVVVSRTNARQRQGRAGRVAPGMAVHMGLTKYRHDTLIDQYQTPEVKRVPLSKLVLTIHSIGLHEQDGSGMAASVCARLLEPPDPLDVERAVHELVRLGALEIDPETGHESLTALGKNLAILPTDPQLGKLILLGAAFGPLATDAALTIAAALSVRSPFLDPGEEELRETSVAAKKGFAERMYHDSVGLSDHLALITAYTDWFKAEDKWTFAQQNFLAMKFLETMAETKRQLLEVVSRAGFVGSDLLRKDDVETLGSSYGNDGVLPALGVHDDSEQCPPALVAALLCAALYPQVLVGTLPKEDESEGEFEYEEARRQDGEAGPLFPRLAAKDASNGEPTAVKLFGGSVFRRVKPSTPFFAYQELVQVKSLINGMNLIYAKHATPVPPVSLVLFGGALGTLDVEEETETEDSSTLILDDWIKLAMEPSVLKQLILLRKRLDDVFGGWVKNKQAGAKYNDPFSQKYDELEQSDEAVERGTFGAHPKFLKAIVNVLNAQEPVKVPTRASKADSRQRRDETPADYTF